MEMLLDILVVKFFGIRLIDPKDFPELVIRFFSNTLIVFIIVRYLYYPTTRDKDYLFTYLMFRVVVFFLCHLLSNVKLSLGFALGQNSKPVVWAS